MDAAMARHWLLKPGLTFLNHGGFGACPIPVLAVQAEWRARMERDPVRFLVRDLPAALDHARARVAAFLNAAPADLVFVPNATSGVNTVLRSIEPDLRPGDELLATDHEYNASLNALRFVAARRGARVVLARVPFPTASSTVVEEAVVAAVTPRTRFALLSHVTSATAIVFPLERLVPQLQSRGIAVLVDGAHAPGMLPLDLAALGAAYYTGNGHKWLCGPKGSAFLVVRRDRQAAVRPLAISHGANAPPGDGPRYLVEAAWKGTDDPTAVLSLPDAIDFMARLHPDGWRGVMAANHALALAGAARVAAALGVEVPAPAELIGSMLALPVPDTVRPVPAPETAPGMSDPDLTRPIDPLEEDLYRAARIRVPVFPWPPVPSTGRAQRLLRISAQLYNDERDYGLLAAELQGR